MNVSHKRLLNQQLIEPQFSTAYEVVDWMGMIQAQDYSFLPWSVGVRMKNPSIRQFADDFNAGKILRTHLFRTTWQLVVAEDLPWMLSLVGERCVRADNTMLRKRGWASDDDLNKARRIVVDMLSGVDYLQKDKIVSRLSQENLLKDNLSFAIFMRRMEFEGLICSGAIDGRTNTYALLEKRCRFKNEFTKEEALAMLARKYFRSHSPATLTDFIWWTGLSKSECVRGIEAIKAELVQENIDNDIYYIHSSCRYCDIDKPIAQLLPSYDEYIIGYKSRHHSLQKEYIRKAYTANGIFFPLISHDGQIIGRWSKKKEYSWFDNDKKVSLAVAEQRYDDFLKK